MFCKIPPKNYLVAVADRLAKDILLGAVPPEVRYHDLIDTVHSRLAKPPERIGAQIVEDWAYLRHTII